MEACACVKKLLLCALLIGSWGCTKREQVVIFATARSQGRLGARREVSHGGKSAGGFAVFKRLYDLEKRPKLALDSGDWFSAAPEGWLTRGRSAVACLNAAGYSAAALGMEELSLPPAELEKLSATAKFPVLASNLYLKNNKKPEFLSSQAILKTGGKKIGVFSVIIASPGRPDRQKYLANYKLEKETYEAERAVKALTDGGASVIVMLAGINPKEKAGQEFYRNLILKVPKIDLVLTDEPSIKKPFRINRTWVAGSGREMFSAARLVLSLDKGSGRITGMDWDEIPLYTAKYGQDQGVLEVISGYRKAAAAHFSKRVGALSASLPLSENGASPVADFAADCIKRWAKTNAALIGITEPAAGFSSGTVTVGDLYAAFPLDSSVVFVKIRGDDLERALTGIPPGEISVSGLRLFLKDGTLERAETDEGPIIPGRVYKLAVPDSFVGGRDNALLSSAMEFVNSRRYLREIIGWCFSRQKTFSRPEGGRMVKI